MFLAVMADADGGEVEPETTRTVDRLLGTRTDPDREGIPRVDVE